MSNGVRLLPQRSVINGGIVLCRAGLLFWILEGHHSLWPHVSKPT